MACRLRIRMCAAWKLRNRSSISSMKYLIDDVIRTQLEPRLISIVVLRLDISSIPLVACMYVEYSSTANVVQWQP